MTSLSNHTADEIEAVAREWRCFHCGEVFTTTETAREHFGADEIAAPACQIDITEYRRLEDQQAACRAECCEEAKRYWAAEDDRRRALVREEQRGYDKGLTDGRTEILERCRAVAEENKLHWASKVDPLEPNEPSRNFYRAKAAACFQVEMDIAALDHARAQQQPSEAVTESQEIDITEVLQDFSAEERMRAFMDIRLNFCVGCGSDNPDCQCQNDE